VKVPQAVFAWEIPAVHPLPHPFSCPQAKSCVRVGWRSLSDRAAHRPPSFGGVVDTHIPTALPASAPDLPARMQARGCREQEPGVTKALALRPFLRPLPYRTLNEPMRAPSLKAAPAVRWLSGPFRTWAASPFFQFLRGFRPAAWRGVTVSSTHQAAQSPAPRQLWAKGFLQTSGRRHFCGNRDLIRADLLVFRSRSPLLLAAHHPLGRRM